MRARLAMGLLVLAATVMVVPVPAVAAASGACRVRNVTQGTHGASFRTMVRRSVDGDRLRLRGTCTGGVTIDKDLRIRGVGGSPVLSGRGRLRVLNVKAGASVVLTHLTIARGGHWQGGISNHGTMILTDVAVTNNAGTGIENRGYATMMATRIRVTRNTDSRWGAGGIGNSPGATMVLRDSIVRRNTGYWGGGIHNEGGTLVLIGSRVASNRAQAYDSRTAGEGGGIFNMAMGTVILTGGSTVTGNTADRRGGGVMNHPADGRGTIALDATSSVTGNTPDDCRGTSVC